jgi:hypothetical protein
VYRWSSIGTICGGVSTHFPTHAFTRCLLKKKKTAIDDDTVHERQQQLQGQQGERTPRHWLFSLLHCTSTTYVLVNEKTEKTDPSVDKQSTEQLSRNACWNALLLLQVHILPSILRVYGQTDRSLVTNSKPKAELECQRLVTQHSVFAIPDWRTPTVASFIFFGSCLHGHNKQGSTSGIPRVSDLQLYMYYCSGQEHPALDWTENILNYLWFFTVWSFAR